METFLTILTIATSALLIIGGGIVSLLIWRFNDVQNRADEQNKRLANQIDKLDNKFDATIERTTNNFESAVEKIGAEYLRRQDRLEDELNQKRNKLEDEIKLTIVSLLERFDRLEERADTHIGEGTGVKSDLSWVKKAIERIEKKMFNGHSG